MFNQQAAIEYIHQEIASNGTNSEFVGRGLDMETGEYDVEKIAADIERGEFPELASLFAE
jgi:hypothetical protein